jgi:N-acetylglucosamine-6-phosphate deacetylase
VVKVRRDIVRGVSRKSAKEGRVSQRISLLVTAAVALMVGYMLGGPWISAQQRGAMPASIAAVPNQIGGQDVFGA